MDKKKSSGAELRPAVQARPSIMGNMYTEIHVLHASVDTPIRIHAHVHLHLCVHTHTICYHRHLWQAFSQLCAVLDKLRRCVALNYTIVTKMAERYDKARPWVATVPRHIHPAECVLAGNGFSAQGRRQQ